MLTSILNSVLGASVVRTDPVTDEVSFHLSGGFYAGLLISLVVGLAYYVLLEGRPKGQPVGKMAVGIRLGDAATGGPIGYGRALGRRLVGTLLAYTFIGGILDVLWPLWDDRKQTLHDKALSSVVVTT